MIFYFLKLHEKIKILDIMLTYIFNAFNFGFCTYNSKKNEDFYEPKELFIVFNIERMFFLSN